MLTKEDIQKIIDECRITANEGLRNGTKGLIPKLKVDFLSPPADFLGKQENPAIFVNHHTYSFLGKHHASWRRKSNDCSKGTFSRKRSCHGDWHYCS